MTTQMHPDGNPNNTWKSITAVLGILLLGALIFGSVFYSKYKDSARQATDLGTTLDETKAKLEGELASLNSAYTQQMSENDTLSADLQVKVAEVEDLKVRIAKARKELKTSQANSEAIKARLAQMEELKVALEADIQGLRQENQVLTVSNQALNENLGNAKSDINNLNHQVMSLTQANEKLTGRLRTLAPAGFRADNFTITSANRKEKVTSKSRRIDAVTVSFDLNNIPEEYQGARNLYLVLTEFNGNPVEAVPTKEVKVTNGQQSVNVLAADAQEVQLRNRQSVTMKFAPEEDLNPGTYNVLVYADNGYLGSTGFLVSK